MKAVIVLSDGTVVEGKGFGAPTVSCGELVFNTSMMGYEETLTDPSYGGQILLMTYPLIGNYGISAKWRESDKIHPSAFVIKELSKTYMNKDAFESLDAFLKENGTPGIYDLDTRYLVRHIRKKGVVPSIVAVSKTEIDHKALLKKLKFNYSSIDFVEKVSTKKVQKFGTGKTKLVLVDFGVKMGIIRELINRDCEVTVVPFNFSTEQIKSLKPDGIVLSNGPGDPAILKEAHKTIKELKSIAPIFGICLGHQLLAHAFGGNTYKLKFGHRGSNHAVLEIDSQKTSITTQNHGFAVGKLPKGFRLTHLNLNDESIEGMESDDGQIFSVQYHPEATPGPKDSLYLFDRFLALIKK